jgi:hypothetical protein
MVSGHGFPIAESCDTIAQLALVPLERDRIDARKHPTGKGTAEREAVQKPHDEHTVLRSIGLLLVWPGISAFIPETQGG